MSTVILEYIYTKAHTKFLFKTFDIRCIHNIRTTSSLIQADFIIIIASLILQW